MLWIIDTQSTRGRRSRSQRDRPAPGTNLSAPATPLVRRGRTRRCRAGRSASRAGADAPMPVSRETTAATRVPGSPACDWPVAARADQPRDRGSILRGITRQPARPPLPLVPRMNHRSGRENESSASAGTTAARAAGAGDDGRGGRRGGGEAAADGEARRRGRRGWRGWRGRHCFHRRRGSDVPAAEGGPSEVGPEARRLPRPRCASMGKRAVRPGT